LNTASISFPLFGEGFAVDPPASFPIFGFDIYLYGLFITAGFAAAAVYLIWRRDKVGLTKDNILDLVIMAVPCGLIGARIYYMIFNFDLYFGPGKWQNIIAFREGGLAVYGGIIASGLAFLIYSRVKKIPVGNLLDAAGFGLFIGQALGRWGNFFNREAFGIETSMPWRMGLTFENNIYIASLGKTFPAGVVHYFHPAFLYESLWNAAGLVLMHVFSNKSKAKYPGQYFLFYVFWYGLGRAFIEGVRIDSLYIPGTGIRASQLLAALSCLAAGAMLILYKGRKAVAEGPEEGEDDSESEGDSEADEPAGDISDDSEEPAADDEADDPAGDTSDDSEEPAADDEADDPAGDTSDGSEEPAADDEADEPADDVSDDTGNEDEDDKNKEQQAE